MIAVHYYCCLSYRGVFEILKGRSILVYLITIMWWVFLFIGETNNAYIFVIDCFYNVIYIYSFPDNIMRNIIVLLGY